MKIFKIKQNEEYITLSNLLKVSDITQSGGEAKILIQSGSCYVDEEVCLMRGKKLKGGEIVKINRNGEIILIKVVKGED